MEEEFRQRRDYVRSVMRFLPQVERPKQPVPLHHKYLYTAASVFIFMAAWQLPLYGTTVKPSTRSDPFYYLHLTFASNWGTLAGLGILPVFVPEYAVRMYYPWFLNVEHGTREGSMLLDKAHKVMGIRTAFLLAPIYALAHVIQGQVYTGTLNVVLIMLQLFFSGVIVLYLDEVLKKGYGLLPSIPLFTATSICASVLWKAFSPSYHGQSAQLEGPFVSLVHFLITRTDKLSAICQAFGCQNLLNVTNLLATCLFCLIAIFVQGFSVVLPVRVYGVRGLQFIYRLKLSYITYAAIVLQRILLTYLFHSVQMIYTALDLLASLPGTWDSNDGKCLGANWIAYYLTAPPTLVDLHRDPVPVFIYIVILISACAFFSAVAASHSLLYVRFVCQIVPAHVELAEPDAITHREAQSRRSPLVKGAYVGGACVGALIVLADFAGVAGSGMGIMLAVAAVYPYFVGVRGEDTGVFGI